MFIVSKALFISSATVIVHVEGVIWLNSFATMFLKECCVLYTCCVGVFGMFAVM